MGAGSAMMIAGMVGAAVSIPLFIVSGSNKRKARLSFESLENKAGELRLDNSKGFVYLFVYILRMCGFCFKFR